MIYGLKLPHQKYEFFPFNLLIMILIIIVVTYWSHCQSLITIYESAITPKEAVSDLITRVFYHPFVSRTKMIDWEQVVYFCSFMHKSNRTNAEILVLLNSVFLWITVFCNSNRPFKIQLSIVHVNTRPKINIFETSLNFMKIFSADCVIKIKGTCCAPVTSK